MQSPIHAQYFWQNLCSLHYRWNCADKRFGCFSTQNDYVTQPVVLH